MKMIKKIMGVISAAALLAGVSVFTVSVPSHAALNDSVCNGVNTVLNGGDTVSSGTAADCTSGDTTENQLAKTVNNLINLFSIIVGAVSVVMIIYGGFKYITSGGSDDATKSAKNTILYSLVGLVIVLLSQTIVKFVFGKALDLGSNSQ